MKILNRVGGAFLLLVLVYGRDPGLPVADGRGRSGTPCGRPDPRSWGGSGDQIGNG